MDLKVWAHVPPNHRQHSPHPHAISFSILSHTISYKEISKVWQNKGKPTAECFKDIYKNSKFFNNVAPTLGKGIVKFLDVQIFVSMMQQELGLAAPLCCMKIHLSPLPDNRCAYREFDTDGKWGTRMLELFLVFKTKSLQSSND